MLVGFALETGDVASLAAEKMRKKGARIMVANHPDDALGGDATRAILMNDRGLEEDTGPVSKAALADRILDELASYWNE